jgi:FkbM family methyltransferase
LVGENGQVLGFEPDDDSFDSLSKNIKQSKFSENIIIQKTGVYDFDGEISFSGNGSMASKIETNSTSALKKIKVKTLDTIADEFKLKRCDFIKMDIEGSEIQVLKSSKEFL